jgi:hypothetical protein
MYVLGPFALEWGIFKPGCVYDIWNIRDHLWHRYPITVNQVMMVTVQFSKWWLELRYNILIKDHLSSPPVFSGVRVTRYLVLYVCFVDRCLSFCTFPLAIVLSVLLRYTDSDCPVGIFKLFLLSRSRINIWNDPGIESIICPVLRVWTKNHNFYFFLL